MHSPLSPPPLPPPPPLLDLHRYILHEYIQTILMPARPCPAEMRWMGWGGVGW
jgi:hypothetical protein